ncbi:MAG: beta-galactosidase [Phycisphaerae bacterium]|nr:beta-galactosidase [Phycisphaerae bacterium]
MMNTFLYGTHYFRPPNPPRDEHRGHLTKIRQELGFDVVKLRMQWNAIHRQPDVFEWDEYDEIVAICNDVGLRFILEMNLETAPYWLERRHPEARYVSANGQAIELGPYDATQFGGYPGLCFDNDVVPAEAARYVVAMVEHFRDCDHLLCYDCWNEPHLEPAWICNYWGNMGDRLFCYCAASRRAFRGWLERKYQTVAALNAAWGRAYGEWDDVQPPNRHGTYGDWLDWARFWHDQLMNHMQWRYDTIKALDPGRIVKSHSGAVPPFLSRPNAFIHNEKLAQPVDVWGTSFSPKIHNWTLADCAGTIDAARSAAAGKEFWISEMTGGSTYIARGFGKTPLPTEKDYRAWNWLSVVGGAKATIHWCYLEESTGPEAGSYGLVRANGDITPRAKAAARTAALLRKHSDLILPHQPAAQVGVLFDPDNSTQLFAMENNDDLHTHSHMGYYRAIWQVDATARYVTYDSLDRLAGLEVLVVPMCLTLPESAADAIAQFVEDGGTLIAEARTGLFDHRGFIRPTLPAGRLTEVCGCVENEALYSDPDNRPHNNNPDNDPWPEPIYNGPDIEFSDPATIRMKTMQYLVPLTPTTGKPIAECMGHTLAVENTFGKGRAYYIGTYLGVGVYRRDPGAVELLTTLLRKHTQVPIRANRLRPRLMRGQNEAILAVFNDSRTQEQTETIEIPDEYRNATPVYEGQEIRFEKGKVTLTVAPEDACIVHLT